MIVTVRRRGVLVRTVDLMRPEIRIGSGPECEVRLDDDRLPPVAAEIVSRWSEWRMVDKGTLPGGVRRGNIKVVDEPMEPEEPYTIGDFEVLCNGNASRLQFERTMVMDEDPDALEQTADLSQDQPADDDMPLTMVQSDVPTTTLIQESFEGMPRRRAAVRFEPAPKPGPRLAFQPAPEESSTTTPAPSYRFAIAIAVVVVAALAAVFVLMRDRSPTPDASQAAMKPAEPSPAENAAAGDRFARDLQIEKAFAAWEAAAGKNNDPALKAKIADGAMQLARAYAANGDPARAKLYLDKVIRYGTDQQIEAARY